MAGDNSSKPPDSLHLALCSSVRQRYWLTKYRISVCVSHLYSPRLYSPLCSGHLLPEILTLIRTSTQNLAHGSRNTLLTAVPEGLGTYTCSKSVSCTNPFWARTWMSPLPRIPLWGLWVQGDVRRVVKYPTRKQLPGPGLSTQ